MYYVVYVAIGNSILTNYNISMHKLRQRVGRETDGSTGALRNIIIVNYTFLCTSTTYVCTLSYTYAKFAYFYPSE